MEPAVIVRSIASAGQAIGSRAARHLDVAFRQLIREPTAERGDGYLRLVTGEAHPLGNVAIVSDPRDAAITQTAIAPLLDCGFPAAVLYPDGVSDEVARVVTRHGFERQGAMPAMAVDIDRVASTALPPGHAWERVGVGEGGREWTAALAAGYGIPDGLAAVWSPDRMGADAAPDARLQFFGIRAGDRMVATSLLYLADGLAGIYCVATLPEARGRGLGAHATAEALRTARRLGYLVGVLQSSPAGHSVYVRLGFADFGSVPMFARMPD